MCELLSGWINVKTEEVAIVDLRSHSETAKLLKWDAATIAAHREWEWLRDDDGASLAVRHQPDDPPDRPKMLRACILALWKTRTEAIYGCIELAAKAGATRIDVSNAGLTSLPKLPKVTALYCHNNQLTSLPKLPKVTALYCDNNQLKSLPDLPKVTRLYCDNNQLTSLPDLPKVTTLYCDNNQLKSLPKLDPKAYVSCDANLR